MYLLTKTASDSKTKVHGCSLDVHIKHFTTPLSKSNLFWISEEKITYKLDFLSQMYVYERETNHLVPNQMNRTKKLFMFTNLFAYHYYLINGHD